MVNLVCLLLTSIIDGSNVCSVCMYTIGLTVCLSCKWKLEATKIGMHDELSAELHRAARVEKVNALTVLVSAGVKTRTKQHGLHTPLHSAAMTINPNADIVRLLIDSCNGRHYLEETRNSAIAGKPRDAFTGQSRPPNMVLFHMLGRPIVSY